MNIYLRLINPIFGLDCNNFEFRDVDSISNDTHLEIIDKASMQLEFKCRLDNTVTESDCKSVVWLEA